MLAGQWVQIRGAVLEGQKARERQVHIPQRGHLPGTVERGCSARKGNLQIQR